MYELPCVYLSFEQSDSNARILATFKMPFSLGYAQVLTIFVAASLVSSLACSKPQVHVHGHSELCHTLLNPQVQLSHTISSLLSVAILLSSPGLLSDEVSTPACHLFRNVLLNLGEYFLTDFGPPVLFLLPLSGHSPTPSLVSWVVERLGEPMVGVLKKVKPILYLAALM